MGNNGMIDDKTKRLSGQRQKRQWMLPYLEEKKGVGDAVQDCQPTQEESSSSLPPKVNAESLPKSPVWPFSQRLGRGWRGIPQKCGLEGGGEEKKNQVFWSFSGITTFFAALAARLDWKKGDNGRRRHPTPPSLPPLVVQQDCCLFFLTSLELWSGNPTRQPSR